MVHWFLNDYGILHPLVFILIVVVFAFVSFCLIGFVISFALFCLGHIFLWVKRNINLRKPKTSIKSNRLNDDDILQIFSFFGILIFTVSWILSILYFASLLMEPLKIAVKYASPQQKIRLYDCLKAEYGTGNFEDTGLPLESSVAKAVIECQERDRADKNYKQTREDAETAKELMQKLKEEK